MTQDPTEVADFEAFFVETLGMPFLAFVLSVDDEAGIPNRLERTGGLSEKQRSVVSDLAVFLVRQRQSLPPDSLADLPFFLGDLFTFRPDLGMAWPAFARLETGGSLDLPHRDDPVLSALLELARDLYPAFLLPPPRDSWPRFGPPHASLTSLYRHPRHDAFVEVVMNDPALSKLFPLEDESGPRGTIFRSTGGGGDLQVVLLASTILSAAWRSARRLSSRPTLRQFAEHAMESVGIIRRAVLGQPVTIPAVTGLAGIRLNRGQTLTLPGGAQLRGTTEAELEEAPSSLKGKLTTTTAEGRHVEVDYSGDLVLATNVPYELDITEAWTPTQPFPVVTSSRDMLERELENLRLGLVLSTTRATLPNVLRTWQVFHDPLDLAGMSWSDPRRAPNLLPVFLDWREARAWKDWTHRIARHRKSSIDVAIRRTLSAASERADPADALIDSVIVWENLVGSRQGEPTLRVSAALAWLLGQDSDERKALRAEVSKLYGLRSDIVHGNRYIDAAAASGPRTAALGIAVRALRTLLGPRADLLGACQDGTELSNRLIMDG